MPNYQITEPHPTVAPNRYIHTGIGGAGNKVKISSGKRSSLSSTLSRSTPPHNPSAKASTGRGGAGNIHFSSELPLFSFDEEMDAQVGREKGHEIWHVGRGGAGNRNSRRPDGERKTSVESHGSDSSPRSSGFFGRLSGAFERH
jgi:Protein of unknown function (DUF3602)